MGFLSEILMKRNRYSQEIDMKRNEKKESLGKKVGRKIDLNVQISITDSVS